MMNENMIDKMVQESYLKERKRRLVRLVIDSLHVQEETIRSFMGPLLKGPFGRRANEALEKIANDARTLASQLSDYLGWYETRPERMPAYVQTNFEDHIKFLQEEFSKASKKIVDGEDK